MKSFILTLWISFFVLIPAMSATSLQVVVDGQLVQFLNVSPYLDQQTGRTMVPVRFIAERLGISVQWKEAQNQVVFRAENKEIIVSIRENYALVNGKKIALDTPAVIKNQRTMIPLRFISEGFGVDVHWTAESNRVDVTTQKAFPRSTWVWEAKIIETDPSQILEFASNNQLNSIYLQADRDVDESLYRKFISRATKLGIEVEALGGAPRWVKKENQHEIIKHLEWVNTYNTSAGSNEKFAGLHFDIEPYLLDEWDTKREDVLHKWMDTIRLIERESRGMGLKMSFDVPFWIHKINVPGSNHYSFSTWLLEKADRLVIMDYRNFALGNDGIVENGRQVLREAITLGKQVVVAVDTARSTEGDKTTFYSRSKGEMEKELSIAGKELSRYSSFAGFAIHDYKNWILIK